MTDPAIYARMLALIQTMSGQPDAMNKPWNPKGWHKEAEDIMALVNPPVDPDVQTVRDILHAHQRAMTPPDSGWGNMSYEKGSYDDMATFKAALAAYKGRDLQKAEQSTEAVELLDRAHRSCSMGSSLYEDIDAFLTRHDKEPS